MFGLHKEGLAEHYCLSEVLHWGTTTRVDFVYYLAKKKHRVWLLFSDLVC